MADNLIREKQFEMRLMEIYDEHDYLSTQISRADFIKLFPVTYKNGKIVRLDRPVGFDLDRDIYLEVLVAFRGVFF